MSIPYPKPWRPPIQPSGLGYPKMGLCKRCGQPLQRTCPQHSMHDECSAIQRRENVAKSKAKARRQNR